MEKNYISLRECLGVEKLKDNATLLNKLVDIVKKKHINGIVWLSMDIPISQSVLFSYEFKQILMLDNLSLVFKELDSKVKKSLQVFAELNSLNIHVCEVVELESVKTSSLVSEIIGQVSRNYWECRHRSIDLSRHINQISRSKTIDSLVEVLHQIVPLTVQSVTFDLKSIRIADKFIKELYHRCVDDFKGRLGVKLISSNKGIQTYFDTLNDLSPVYNCSKQELARLLQMSLERDTPIMFSRYIETSKKDPLGRVGYGTVLSCRVGIYRYTYEKDNEYYVVIDEYKTSTFSSKDSYTYTHNTTHKGLEYNRLHIPIEKVGFDNKFIGSHYHINLPIIDPNEVIPYKSLISGRVEELLLPEYIQNVLDDFKIQYNKQSLLSCISLSYKLCSNNVHK